jgi:gliding motility-associated-like protein
MTVGLFNSDPGNMPQLTGRRTDLARSYVFVDNIELFRIPTAGPNHPCSGSGPAGPVHLGEGCSIPGATYAWRKVGDPTVIASTIETDVTPPATTTYELTVTLPDGSTYRTTTQVDVCVYSVALNVTNNRANNCGPRVLTAAVVYGSGNYSYFWNSNPAASGNIGNTSSITVNPSVVTTYTVLVYDNVTGRAVQSSVVVGPEINGTPSVFVPNIFTPNGDGVNDTWQVRDASRGFGPIHAYGYRLQVFDRWGGQKLDRSFTDTQFNSLGLMGGQIQWDGRDANGQGCVDGDYYYYVTLYNCSQAYTDYLKGWVTINGSRYRAAAPDIHPPVEVASRLAVYPNPANERLLIDPAVLSEAAKASGATVGSPRYQVELRDKTGQLRYSGTAADQQLEVDTKALPAGLYFLRLTGPKGEVVTKQIVVDHTR